MLRLLSEPNLNARKDFSAKRNLFLKDGVRVHTDIFTARCPDLTLYVYFWWICLKADLFRPCSGTLEEIRVNVREDIVTIQTYLLEKRIGKFV